MIAEEYKYGKKHTVFVRPSVDTRTGVAVLNVRVFAVPAAERGRLLQYSQTTKVLHTSTGKNNALIVAKVNLPKDEASLSTEEIERINMGQI